MPVENSPAWKLIANETHTKIGTGIRLLSGALKGETLRPCRRLFLIYAKIVVLDHLRQKSVAACLLVFREHLAMFIENLFVIRIADQVLHFAGVVLHVD